MYSAFPTNIRMTVGAVSTLLAGYEGERTAHMFWVPSPALALNPLGGLSKPFNLSESHIICETIELE